MARCVGGPHAIGGGIVSTVPVAKGPLHEFSAVVRFRIAGQGQTLFGDGLAMWFTRGEGRRQREPSQR